jgi:hypothetical protein
VFNRNRRPENQAFWAAIAASNRERHQQAASARGAGAPDIIRVDFDLPLFYVCVFDSADKPELFSTPAEAEAWAQANRPAWRTTTAMVYQRWNARISLDNLRRQAREEGWYRPGPAPRPERPGVASPERRYVGVAHAGHRVRVYADRSDAEANHFLSKLDPYACEVITLHAVRMRPVAARGEPSPPRSR